MMAEQEVLWTCIARCRTCGAELNRAEHVPANKKALVGMGAAFGSFCKYAAHNTERDINFNIKTEWIEEDTGADHHD